MCAAVLGGLLRSGVAEAAPIVAALTPEMFTDPCHRFVYAAIRAAVDAGLDPAPLVAADAAIRAGLDAPPAWHASQLTELHRLESGAPALPSLGWYAGRLVDYSARRAADRALVRAHAAVWRGDLVDVLAVVRAESGSAVAVLAGVAR